MERAPVGQDRLRKGGDINVFGQALLSLNCYLSGTGLSHLCKDLIYLFFFQSHQCLRGQVYSESFHSLVLITADCLRHTVQMVGIETIRELNTLTVMNSWYS